MKYTSRWVLGVVGAAMAVNTLAGTYSEHTEAKAFIKKMVDDHQFSAQEITTVLAQADKKQAILDAIARPAEKTKPWYEYREIFLGQERIAQGVEFWVDNAKALADAEQTFGVSAAVIVAIIGVETRYGRQMGAYRVVDALATLGFDYPPRAKFFSGQLEQLFLLAREQKKEPLSMLGSYAGAMGYGQFIPSSYRSFARDFDGDGFADIWQNKTDAIGSIANYFKAHGWQTHEPVFTPAKLTKAVADDLLDSRVRPETTLKAWEQLGVEPEGSFAADNAAVLLSYEQPQGPEYWLGFNNFYVITRYNRSQMYARAVWELSEEVKAAYAKHSAKPTDAKAKIQ